MHSYVPSKQLLNKLERIRQSPINLPATSAEASERFMSQAPALLEIAKRIAEAVVKLGTETAPEDQNPRALVVGGFVRDALLGNTPKDLDVQVYGVSPARVLELMESIFPGEVERIGRSYEIVKVNLDAGIELEVSVARYHTGPESAPFEAGDPALSVKEAARLRDFSFNNFAADPLTGEVFDMWAGLDDLRSRRLKITYPAYFCHNAVQVYRAAQFCGRMGLWPDQASFDLMYTLIRTDALAGVSPRRITEELTKLLIRAQYPSIGLEVLRCAGIIERYYPELFELIKVATSNRDQWASTLLTLDEGASRLNVAALEHSEKLMFMLALLCTDLSESAVRSLLARLCYPRYICAAILSARANIPRILELYRQDRAMQPAQIPPRRGVLKPFERQKSSQQRSYTADLTRLLGEAYPATWKVLELLGTFWHGREPDSINALKMFSEQVKKDKLHALKRETLLQREDLINTFGLKRGPQLGFIIGEVERLRYEVITKTEALKFVRENLDELLEQARLALADQP